MDFTVDQEYRGVEYPVSRKLIKKINQKKDNKNIDKLKMTKFINKMLNVNVKWES